MLNFRDFIQVYVFTTNHHLNQTVDINVYNGYILREAILLFPFLSPFSMGVNS